MSRQKRPGDSLLQRQGAASWQSWALCFPSQLSLFGADSCAQLQGKAELMEQGQPRPSWLPEAAPGNKAGREKVQILDRAQLCL